MGENMNTFNLKKYMKTAFYEDVRGYWNGQSRAWMNCYKLKCDNGMGPQKAWDGCLKDYQEAIDKSTWVLSYTSDKIKENDRPYLGDKASKTPAAQKIVK